MLVLIDESGDPGFKIVRGSSAHFVVSMVIFSDFDCAERCSAAINKVRKDVAISGEFKFNKCTDRVRDAFFVAIKDYDFRILQAVESVNQYQKTVLFEKMAAHFGNLKGKVVAIWGLAFKPRTDDMREAPAVPLIEALLASGAKVRVFDPEAMDVARRTFEGRVSYAKNPYEAVKGADALALVTEWNEFRRPDFERIQRSMRTPVVFDGRNIYTPEQMKAAGFTYYSIGR